MWSGRQGVHGVLRADHTLGTSSRLDLCNSKPSCDAFTTKAQIKKKKKTLLAPRIVGYSL